MKQVTLILLIILCVIGGFGLVTFNSHSSTAFSDYFQFISSAALLHIAYSLKDIHKHQTNSSSK